MSYSSIQIDFNVACAQAKKLEDCAEEMKRLANQKMSNAIDEMSAGWKGESATAYFKKADAVKKNIIATSETLYTVANSIRTQAKRIYDAEREALRIAEQRNAGSGGFR